MYLGNHCFGCGNENQSCKIAKCSLENGSIEYCNECSKYPCERYENIDEYDSFISHRNQKKDLTKAKVIGIDQYNKEQMEKMEILQTLLQHYNDGRKKTFYCVAVNVLDLVELRTIMELISNLNLESLSEKERCKMVYDVFVEKETKTGVAFKLRKKATKKEYSV